MLVREQKQTKKSTGVFISLTIHAALVALLFLAMAEKRLADSFLGQPQSLIADALKNKQAEKEKSPSAKAIEEKKALEDPAKKQATLNQPFVVPAPVVFYGNQAMMNKPVPVSGHSEGKSAFEHAPSALPTPPAHAIAPERTPSITAPQQLANNPKPADNQNLQEAQKEQVKIERTEMVQEMPSVDDSSLSNILEESKEPESILKQELQQGEGTLLLALQEISKKRKPQNKTAQETENVPRTKPQTSQDAKKLTLADLFKNATSSIASFAQDGLPSARKAGTEGGDDQGSGHQITIKEGDMKYYTLWAKFLNHLNQSARFNRRGKEGMIQTWINNKEIRYILQCGITVDMQGKIIDIEIMISSGCPGFDKLCISDIKSAVPYPPLPESLGKKTARFEVNVYP